MSSLARILLPLPLLVLIVFSGCGSTSSPADVEGSWQGAVKQNNGEKFGIEAEIGKLEEGKRSARVSYPGLGTKKGCSGYWVYNGRNGDLYKFSETITAGKNPRCGDSGEVSITPAGDRLDYGWRLGAAQSAGTLSRR